MEMQKTDRIKIQRGDQTQITSHRTTEEGGTTQRVVGREDTGQGEDGSDGRNKEPMFPQFSGINYRETGVNQAGGTSVN